MPTQATTPEAAKQEVRDTYTPQWQAASTAAQKLQVLRAMQVEINASESQLTDIRNLHDVEDARYTELRRLVKLGLTDVLG